MLSGPSWKEKFPTSTSTAALSLGFRTKVEEFLAALRSAGAGVFIAATLRPPERAYLMHWAWMIARERYNPSKVPRLSGVDIQWVHSAFAHQSSEMLSRAAAEQMVRAYQIRYCPSLKSRHTEGRAIDMTITWSGTLTILDKFSNPVAIEASPHNGGNFALQCVGKTYGVQKLRSDPPHWSDAGH
jgi:D-alanyl-D-alanine dipeptidase